MKFKKFLALICTFAFMLSNLINVHAINYVNVAFVGDQETGKTSVVRRIREGTFKNEYISTVGTDYCTWQIENNNEARIWDLSGQERFWNVIKCAYLNAAKIVTICSNITCRDSIDNVGKWMEKVKKSRCSENAVVIWVINKIELEETEGAVTRAEIEAKAKANDIELEHIIYTSASTGKGIEDLRKTLCRSANEFFATDLAARKAAEAEVNAALGRKLLTATVTAAVVGAVIGTIRLIRNWLVNNRARSLPNNYEIKT
ncbi:MAG: GTP-binding protein [Oscillospiraceae bacterium]|nr:GTP-binding protein [Oscillospiraceae bacterium]